jgi:maleamate amidohydrolase
MMTDEQADRPWMALIPDSDRRTYRSGGFLSGLAAGARPALVVIDCTWSFCGSQGLTLEQAIEEFHTACGPAAWDALPRIATLIDLFRARGLPIVFTHSDVRDTPFTGKATKSRRPPSTKPHAEDFPPPVTPLPDEWVLAKTKASAFFGTPLTTWLVREQVDTLVFCGVSTSGCVRASVVDGFSHGFATVVVDDCCFDRSEFAHAANLFDMAAKYAAVVPLSGVAGLLPRSRQAA